MNKAMVRAIETLYQDITFLKMIIEMLNRSIEQLVVGDGY